MQLSRDKRITYRPNHTYRLVTLQRSTERPCHWCGNGLAAGDDVVRINRIIPTAERIRGRSLRFNAHVKCFNAKVDLPVKLPAGSPSLSEPQKENEATFQQSGSQQEPSGVAQDRDEHVRIGPLAQPASPPERFGGTTVEEFLQAVRDDASLRSRLRARLAQLADYDFEFLIKRYLEVVEGMTGVEVTPQSRDRGIDLYGDRPATPYKRRVAVQAKKWLGATVGSREIQQFRGAIQGEFPEGIFVTLSRFSSDAIDEAAKSGRLPVKLIDGEQLVSALLEHGAGVRRHTAEVKLSFEVTSIDEDFFSGLRSD